jgi:glycosyltransferase involved in cell wall biosynthesis
MILTMIIPTRNEARHIRACVETLRWAAEAGLAEILVVDNASTDGTPDLAWAEGARVFAQGPERSAQRNRGAREAAGDYLLFVDADMRVVRPTLEEVIRRLRAPDAPDALYIREQMEGRGWWVAVRNFERTFYNATCIDGLRVIRKTVFMAAGGFDETLYAGEDWDLDRRVLAQGCRVALTDGALRHDEGEFSLRRFLRKKAYYGGNFGLYCRKWNWDATVRKQFGLRYRFWTVFMEKGKWRRSLSHPHLLAGVWLLKACVGAAFWLAMRKAPTTASLAGTG